MSMLKAGVVDIIGMEVNKMGWFSCSHINLELDNGVYYCKECGKEVN